jgi:hypothetical protein
MQGGAWGSLGSPLDSQFFSNVESCLAGTGGLCPTVTGPTSMYMNSLIAIKFINS